MSDIRNKRCVSVIAGKYNGVGSSPRSVGKVSITEVV